MKDFTLLHKSFSNEELPKYISRVEELLNILFDLYDLSHERYWYISDEKINEHIASTIINLKTNFNIDKNDHLVEYLLEKQISAKNEIILNLKLLESNNYTNYVDYINKLFENIRVKSEPLYKKCEEFKEIQIRELVSVYTSFDLFHSFVSNLLGKPIYENIFPSNNFAFDLDNHNQDSEKTEHEDDFTYDEESIGLRLNLLYELGITNLIEEMVLTKNPNSYSDKKTIEIISVILNAKYSSVKPYYSHLGSTKKHKNNPTSKKGYDRLTDILKKYNIILEKVKLPK